jgi:hypothetical protein
MGIELPAAEATTEPTLEVTVEATEQP